MAVKVYGIGPSCVRFVDETTGFDLHPIIDVLIGFAPTPLIETNPIIQYQSTYVFEMTLAIKFAVFFTITIEFI